MYIHNLVYIRTERSIVHTLMHECDGKFIFTYIIIVYGIRICMWASGNSAQDGLRLGVRSIPGPLRELIHLSAIVARVKSSEGV